MKIMYLGLFRDPGFEGLMTILNTLRTHFSKKYTILVNQLSKINECDMVNIHSNGFYEAKKYQYLQKPKIYSLHSNVQCDFLKVFYDLFDFIKLYPTDIRKIFHMLMKLVSCLTPMAVKRYYLKKMEVVILPNQWSARKLNLKNSVVIHHGIDVNKFKKKKMKKGRKINLRYFGHPAPGKGIFEAIRAFSTLDKNKFNKEIFLTFKNKKIQKFIGDKSITIKGHSKNIVDEYNRSDIIVLPYRHAVGAIATPLTLIEAMACERAIITADLPFLREICGNTVLYVKPYSVQDIVQAIKKLQVNPQLRNQLGKRARERIVKYYNQKHMFKEYEKLYQKVR